MSKDIILRRSVAISTFVLLLGYNCLQAQTKEVVVLYNSLPVLVEVGEDGKIERFIKEMPGYLADYNLDTKQSLDGPIQNITSPKASLTDLIGDGPVTVRFDAGSVSSPTAMSLDILNGVAARLRSKTALTATLRAMQSDDNSLIEKHNAQLTSCKNYLIAQGIPAARIVTTLSPKVTTTDEVSITFN